MTSQATRHGIIVRTLLWLVISACFSKSSPRTQSKSRRLLSAHPFGAMERDRDHFDDVGNIQFNTALCAPNQTYFIYRSPNPQRTMNVSAAPIHCEYQETDILRRHQRRENRMAQYTRCVQRRQEQDNSTWRCLRVWSSHNIMRHAIRNRYYHVLEHLLEYQVFSGSASNGCVIDFCLLLKELHPVSCICCYVGECVAGYTLSLCCCFCNCCGGEFCRDFCFCEPPME